jgi:sulfate transport system permease protein
MRTLVHEQEEAAKTMGATATQTFWHIIFPALRPGFLYGITLTFARSLGEFGAVLIVGGGRSLRTETATVYIYRALEERQYAGAWSAALVLGACSLLLVFVTEVLSRRERASEELG